MFGPDSPQGKWEGDVVLANFAYTLPVGTLSLFDYYLDIDDAAAASSNTSGVKLAGSKPLGKLTARTRWRTRNRPRPVRTPPISTRTTGSSKAGSLSRNSASVSAYELLGGDGDHGVLDAARDAARVPGLGRQVPRDAGGRHRGPIRPLHLSVRQARAFHEHRSDGRFSRLTTPTSAARSSARSSTCSSSRARSAWR